MESIWIQPHLQRILLCFVLYCTKVELVLKRMYDETADMARNVLMTGLLFAEIEEGWCNIS